MRITNTSIESLSDEDLDENRRVIVGEIDRRLRLSSGFEDIGHAVKSYFTVCAMDDKGETDTELGEVVINLLKANGYD